jgi:hypothetical protein
MEYLGSAVLYAVYAITPWRNNRILVGNFFFYEVFAEVLYNQDKCRFQLVVRQSPASKDVNTEAEGVTELEAAIRRQPMKIQQTEKTQWLL